MANQRKSKITDKAEARIAALRTIKVPLHFPVDLTVEAYVAKATDTRTRLAALNATRAQMETARSSFDKSEADLSALSSRVLKAVLAQFGPDSDEYATAGGTRLSARKRPIRRPEDADPEPSAPNP